MSIALSAELWAGTVANDGTGAIDTFFNIENLTGGSGNDLLSGNFAANRVEGGAGNDNMFGQEGNDTLVGGLGNDSLNGGAGSDQFVFDTALNGTSNVDSIVDFTANIDRIMIDDAIFTGLLAGGLNAANFIANVGGTAGDTNDFIVYNSTTGDLFFDVDGSGGVAAVRFAALTTHPAITAADFTVI